ISSLHLSNRLASSKEDQHASANTARARERERMAIWRARSISFLTSSLRAARSSAHAGGAAGRGFSTSARVGFIGLGNMGFHMANNLINAGYKVTVHDINQNVMDKFLEKGVPTKETPFDVAESSDIIITMLPSSSHVLNVYTGTNGLLHGNRTLQPWLFIDSSTIDPLTSRSISKQISKCSLKEKKGDISTPVMLDAPVSGGVPRAEAGTLTFMVGGLQEAFLAARPLFLAMGRNTVYCGASGNGVAAKICNNLAMAVSMVGVSEAFALGQRLGITATTLTDIFNSSSARCWSSDSYNPVPGVMEAVPSSRDYNGGFSSKLMFYTKTMSQAKDLTLATASAAEIGFSCPLTLKVRDIYLELCKEGYESKDFACVFRHYYSGKDEP
ncbi:hypothetical protein Taro_047755, partial [Colocasia esculenta]|nr:hypothetical protein [Colocasia esculenta]